MSDLDILQEKTKEKAVDKSKPVTREEFEELKEVVGTIIEKIKTRNF